MPYSTKYTDYNPTDPYGDKSKLLDPSGPGMFGGNQAGYLPQGSAAGATLRQGDAVGGSSPEPQPSSMSTPLPIGDSLTGGASPAAGASGALSSAMPWGALAAAGGMWMNNANQVLDKAKHKKPLTGKDLLGITHPAEAGLYGPHVNAVIPQRHR